VLEFQVSE